MSVKFGLAMLGYARLTGRTLQLDVAVLAGGVTRLYDDLIDGDVDPSADARLADLLGNRPFVAGTDAELLLGRLVYEIERRLGHTPDESVFMALASLHEYQVLSRRQREADVPVDVLEKITRGKGSAANLILCSIVKPSLEPAERELAMDLGEALQSLDDYMDVDLDRAHGVTTLAGLGVVTLPHIAGQLRAMRPRLMACYGRRSTGPYCGMLYFLLLKSWVGRRLPVLGRLARRPARRSAVLAFLSRGADALPPAGPGTLP
ncbi:class 1 isoprenoid biosynthesis enzyme [Streptomyces sp. V1I1]|uniref:class 1 isoprenoid biosynthesis enzyme n=1 Tax=Streptomyces sp. V1I1 TaxID=3042272 RepID=UPI0027D832F3|nr:class 1 isoprenoid biosynthesis enzyme [Streptomyces sp. V1I1]